MRVDSIAGRARAAARDLGHKGDSFSLKMLSIRAGMKTRDEHKSLTNAVGDLAHRDRRVTLAREQRQAGLADRLRGHFATGACRSSHVRPR